MYQYIWAKDKLFNLYWQQFISLNPNASWRYLLNWYIFQLNCCKRNLNKNLSFIIIRNGIPLGLCPLFLEKNNNHLQFSFRGDYQSAPIFDFSLSYKERKDLEKNCFNKVNELAFKYHSDKIMLLIDPISEKENFNYLTKYNFFDTSINTTIIDLELQDNFLWSNLRKSYHSIINRYTSNNSISIMDFNKPDQKIHEIYQKLHCVAAGKKARPIITFSLEYKMLLNDNALLIYLKDQNRIIAISYFYHHRNNAYYASSADNPKLTKGIPYEHAILWEAIKYYKNRGFKQLELGWQHFSNQVFDHPSKKETDISFFKRGFGGKIVPLFRGVKYYSKNLMLKELIENINLLKKNIK
jgi:hypothetical protein